MKLGTLLTSASLAVFGTVLPASAAIVVNGNFEAIGTSATDAANWSGENGTTISRLATGGVGGSAGMLISNVTSASAAGPVSQNTGVQGGDNAVGGTTYAFSFDSLRTYAVGGVFQAQLVARDNLNNVLGFPVNATLTSGNSSFDNFSQSFVAPVGTTRFEINFFAITGAAVGSSSSVVIDNVSIVDPSASSVPEPASLGLLGLAASGLLGRRRGNA